jgi:GT2 family glycosyltransferase
MERNCPKVGIVIVNFNGKEVTSECLASLQNVSYPNLKIVVVDNGSVDGSAQHFREKFPYITIIENKENLGFTGGNNVGIKFLLHTDVDYILLLNNDTVVAPDFISELVKYGEMRKDVGMLCPKIYLYDKPDVIWYAGGNISLWSGILKHIGYKKRDDEKYNEPREVNFVTGCAFFIKREVIEKVGLLDEKLFIYSEDLDLSLRILKSGYKGFYVPSSKIWHKCGISTRKGNGSSFQLYFQTRNFVYVMYKHLTKIQFIYFLLLFFFRWLLFFSLIKIIKLKFKDLFSLWEGFFEAWILMRK